MTHENEDNGEQKQGKIMKTKKIRKNKLNQTKWKEKEKY